ncbi:MAG: ATP synthase F1 subunit epsilon [Planctomycetes bacterium]|nr:ATP synthase F1 subunit epsilon [Planctomycetota bacterium]
MAAELHLRIVTPDRTIVDRKVAGVSFEGVDGGYGILPQHAPLMTAVSHTGTVVITETDGTTVELFASDGFAQMQHNVLTLVCEAGEFATEIDLERVKAAEQKAREKLAGLDRLSAEFIKAEASLKKALAREMVARRRSGTGRLS